MEADIVPLPSEPSRALIALSPPDTVAVIAELAPEQEQPEQQEEHAWDELAVLMVAQVPPPSQQPAAVYLASLSAGSRRTMAAALRTIVQLCQPGQELGEDALGRFAWGALRFQHTTAIRSQLADRYAHATANKMLAALRGVLQAAWRLGQMKADDYQTAILFKPVRGHTEPKGRALKDGEIGALLGVCAADPSLILGRRDAALFSLLYACGLRRSEMVSLDLDHYSRDSHALIVRGKGNKQRTVYVEAVGASSYLQGWLDLRGAEPGPLFCRIRRGGHLSLERLSDQAIYEVLSRRAKAAGVEDVSPHDLRRSCFSAMLDNGVDIVTVQRLAGHANPGTTSNYDRRGEKTKKAGAGTLYLPIVTWAEQKGKGSKEKV